MVRTEYGQTPNTGGEVAKKPAKPKKAPAKSGKSGGASTAKPASKKPAKPASKAPAKPAKSVAKSAPAKAAKSAPVKTASKAPAKGAKVASTKTASGKAAPAKVTAAKNDKPAPKGAPKVDASKSGRKGITIVTPKPAKKSPSKPPPGPLLPASVGRLLDPKGPARKPLIPSGPKATPSRALGAHGGVEEPVTPKATGKSPFGKRDLDRFRALLLAKRAELVGDVNTMETQALRGQSGSLSNLPQHMAEQGSEAYDQSLSLDLAAADRKLIREIDDALNRIAAGTFGLCERTGKPIKIERLEELPWARYSIEAARELERQSMRSLP